jgi:hypothetical protein
MRIPQLEQLQIQRNQGKESLLIFVRNTFVYGLLEKTLRCVRGILVALKFFKQ